VGRRVKLLAGKGGGHMRSRLVLGVVLGLIAAATTGPAWAASNLNLSKSNLNRLVYSSDAMTPAQAAAILADLDRAGRVDEARAGELIRQLLPKHGVQAAKIKKITVRGWDPKRKTMSIILLTNPADEAQAIAVNDAGMPAEKPVKSSK
jgi:hypothetical protein